jgi:hypothetical protein
MQMRSRRILSLAFIPLVFVFFYVVCRMLGPYGFHTLSAGVAIYGVIAILAASLINRCPNCGQQLRSVWVGECSGCHAKFTFPTEPPRTAN